jgi:hypothetical protein
MRQIIFTLFMLGCVCSCASDPDPRDLHQFSCDGFDKDKWMHKTKVIGKQNGVDVIAEHPCSDLCPEYTVRVVRLDASLAECSSVGGVIKEYTVPVGIGVTTVKYCVPIEAVCI